MQINVGVGRAKTIWEWEVFFIRSRVGSSLYKEKGFHTKLKGNNGGK